MSERLEVSVRDPLVWHTGLKSGTVLRSKGEPPTIRIRVKSGSQDHYACQRIRKDGQDDQRERGWSGCLPLASWEIESTPEG